MRRYFAALLAAGVVLAAPAAAYAAERTGDGSTPTTTSSAAGSTPPATPDPSPEPESGTPVPDPSAGAPTPSSDPSAGSSTDASSPANEQDGGASTLEAETSTEQQDPRLRVYDPVVVPGGTVHVEGVGCELGTTAAVRGDGAVLGRLEVTKEEQGGTLFKGDVAIPSGWADGPHKITATCGGRTLGPVTVTVDKTTVESFATVTDTSVYPGQEIGFSGRCELDAPMVSVVDIASNSVLTEVGCAADGRFSGDLTIPQSWVPGVEGSLGFACLGEDGSTSAHRVDFTVIKKPGAGDDMGDDDNGEGELQGGQLPFTGVAGLPVLLGLGGALVVAGGLLLMVRRRAKATSEETPTS